MSRSTEVSAPIMALLAGLLLLWISHVSGPTLAERKSDASPDEWDENRRPSAEQVAKAEAALAGLSSDEKAILNAARALANRPADAEALPPRLRLPMLAPLGSSVGTSTRPQDPWLTLRLAAMLRAGFPARRELVTDLGYLLASPEISRERSFNRLLLEVLVADALFSRKEQDLAASHSAMESRVRKALSLANWSKAAPSSTPNGDQLRDLGCEALCAHIALSRGWLNSAPKGWGAIVTVLCRRLESNKGKLWSEALTGSGKAENRAERGTLWLTLIISLAASRKDPEMEKGTLARMRATAGTHLAKLLNDLCQSNEGLAASDGAALMAMFSPECEPATPKPLAASVRAKALKTLSAGPSRKVAGLGIAEDLMWTVPGAPSTATNPERPDRGPSRMQPVKVNTDPAVAAQYCLALLGALGGMAATGEVAPFCSVEGADERFSALTTLAAHAVPTLEAEVNVTIDNAVRWLKGIQKPDGTFAGAYSQRQAGHALAILALLDAGVSREDPGVVKAMNVLPKLPAGKPMSELDGQVYTYATILLVLQKYYEPEQHESGVFTAGTPEEYRQAVGKVSRALKTSHRDMVGKMVSALTKGDRGYGWSYYHPASADGTENRRFDNNNWRDNSNSQYAVMGLKAASLLGANFDRAIFTNEARRLIKYYRTDDSFKPIQVPLTPEEQKISRTGSLVTSIVPGGWDYMSLPPVAGFNHKPTLAMTAAGVSSLVICRDELALSGKLDSKLAREIELHIRGALEWCGNHYRTALEENSIIEGWGKYYDLYSVERAGVLGDVRLIAGIDWYEVGARALVDSQESNGSWPDVTSQLGYRGRVAATPLRDPKTVDHCLAILFLKKAVVPVQRKTVTTGHEKNDKPAAEEKVPKTP